MFHVHCVVGSMSIVIFVAVVRTEQRPGPSAHVIRRKGSSKFRGQKFRVYELVKAV